MFGEVIEGMKIVYKIVAVATETASLNGQRARNVSKIPVVIEHARRLTSPKTDQ